MSISDHHPQSSALPADAEAAPASWRHKCDDWLERAGEKLNPILVKETRQSLKSKQFLITFVLLLLACWLWSIGGVASVGPEIYYRPSGPSLFLGYYFILSFSLVVMVPFSAFRSFITEQEDNTYELLSISTLAPRQIVTGKLGSTLVQIILYFSAVAPCLAFTYLLRGMDILTMGILMGYVFFGSLGLSAIGILFATLSRQKMLQVAMTVILLGGLFLAFILWTVSTDSLMRWGPRMLDDRDFVPVHVGLALAYITFFMLIVLAAAARLQFPGENGSSPLRMVMLLQQCCFVGWLAWITVAYGKNYGLRDTLYSPAPLLALYWWGMGIFMTAESPELSLRVKRRLPQSLLGRAMLTWFFPGPGTGYVFGVASLAAAVVTDITLSSLYTQQTPWYAIWVSQNSGLSAHWVIMLAGWGYVAGYLGLGALVIGLLRRRWQLSMFGCVIVQVSLPLIVMGIPLVIHLMSPALRGANYSLLQIANPFWTIAHLDSGHAPHYIDLIRILVPCAGLAILGANIVLFVLHEVRQVRIVTPARVLEEEAEFHPAPVPVPLSPWD